MHMARKDRKPRALEQRSPRGLLYSIGSTDALRPALLYFERVDAHHIALILPGPVSGWRAGWQAPQPHNPAGHCQLVITSPPARILVAILWYSYEYEYSYWMT